jgi:hypothetical protein
MSVPPRRRTVVHEAERIDLQVTGPYRYQAVRGVTQMTSAAERM